jgi:hypothetical protein
MFICLLKPACFVCRKGSLDAFIYDTALLDYVQANDSRCTLKTAGASFGSQGYALAFPKGFWLKVKKRINSDDFLLKIFRKNKETFWKTGITGKT